MVDKYAVSELELNITSEKFKKFKSDAYHKFNCFLM